MYPKLNKYSFVKKTPLKDAHVFSFVLGQNRKAITINESASEILEFCDGTHSVKEIAQILHKRYQDEIQQIEKHINNYIEPFITTGAIDNKRSDEPTPNIVRGSTEVYLPNMVCWEITDYCPLDCRHCYMPKKNNNIATRAQIDRVLSEIQHMGVYQVQLTGGEALTNPEFSYILGKLTDMKLCVAVSTSGFYSNDEIWEALEKLKVNSVLRISLDGNEQSHNYIRRNDKSYTRAIEFIERAVKKGIHCQVGTCIVDQTVQEIEEMVKLVRQLGVRYIELGKITDTGNAEKNKVRTAWDESTYMEVLGNLKSKYETANFKIRQIEKEKIERKNCGAGHLSCRIKPNMDITACPMIEIKMGNLGRESIDDIMRKRGKDYQEIETPNVKFCAGCEKQEDCNDCTALGYINKDKVEECLWYQNTKSLLEGNNRSENF